MPKYVYDEENEKCSSHLKTKTTNSKKSKHKHEYDYCVVECLEKKEDFKTGLYSFQNTEHIATYCKICGKIKNVYLGVMEKQPDVDKTQLKHFTVKDIWQKNVDL